MKKISLSPKQKETLDFIKQYITQNGQSPTITEIKDYFKLALRSVAQRIEMLESKGFLIRDNFKHRGISLVENKDIDHISGTVRVPVIASAGCDAAEIYAQEQYGEFLNVDKKMIGNHSDIAAIKAIGDSMIDAGIHSGDYVLVEVTENVSSGDRVVAILGEMAVIKRLKITPTAHILEPESAGNGYSPIIMSDGSKIFGKVLSIIPMNDQNDDYQLIYDPGMGPK
jgi:repressor LexA